jgi:hypothetical protein
MTDRYKTTFKSPKVNEHSSIKSSFTTLAIITAAPFVLGAIFLAKRASDKDRERRLKTGIERMS